MNEVSLREKFLGRDVRLIVRGTVEEEGTALPVLSRVRERRVSERPSAHPRAWATGFASGEDEKQGALRWA